MNSDSWGSLFLVVFLGSVILVPIYLRNRLLARQIEALTVAMQHGIDPERVRESLQLRRDEGDVNGNWKAGQILMALGWAYLPFAVIGILAGLSKPDANIGVLAGLIPGVVCLVVGARLLRIHRTVVGEVSRRPTSELTSAVPAPVPEASQHGR